MTGFLFRPCRDWSEALLCHLRARDTEMRNASPPAAEKALSLRRLLYLGWAAEVSYTSSPPAPQELEQAVGSMLNCVVHPILAEYQRLGRSSADDDAPDLEATRKYAAAWGRACFGIGIEQASECLSTELSVRWLRRICQAFGAHAWGLVLQRAGYGVCTESEAFSHSKVIYSRVRWWGIRAWNVGFEANFALNGKRGEFMQALEIIEKETACSRT